MSSRVFLSAASKEFRSLRARLAASLQRAGFEVEHQDIFPQTSADTVRKLADLVKDCRLVIHIVGHQPGSVANDLALKDLLHQIPADELLPELPELRKELGDLSGITYTQWEAFFALHFGVPLLVYAPAEAEDNAAFAQSTHLKRLKLARKYPEWCNDQAEFTEKILPDVSRELGTPVVAIEQAIAPPKFLHHAAEHFLGREDELALLDKAWDGAELVNVLSIIAWGGVGKTALLAQWIQQRFVARAWQNAQGDPDPWLYFDWSFYEQGTSEDDDENSVRTGSVGDFFERALSFFGDPDPNQPGKGARLAKLVQRQSSLLILDGLEPLQYPFNHQQAGRLIDNDMSDLLNALAVKNPGLCVVTSRQSLTDLDSLRGGAAKESKLSELPKEIAINLLRNLQIIGTDAELTKASEALGRHALSLTLLGRFLYDAHGGEINRRDLINLEEADEATRPDRKRTAWKILEAYDAWLASDEGRPEELAVLRLTGLFDRPARADCLKALREEPIIQGLTEALGSVSEPRWNILLKRLERAGLIALRVEDGGALGIDAHPLIREYFAKQVREQQPDAFKTAHSRLFEHLCEHTEHQPDTLEGLQPLYQAVVHGCLAGRQQEAKYCVYEMRILRGTGNDGFYSTKKLGALGADLGAVAVFFEQPWTQLSPNLSEADQAWLLSEAAIRLRALGRLTEALGPMLVSIEMAAKQKDLNNAAIYASSLSELKVTLGRLGEAVADARRAVDFAENSGDAAQRMINRITAADALHQSGERGQAWGLFEEAEALQFDLLYSVGGFRFCDLILGPAERDAWQCNSGVQPEPRRQDADATIALKDASRRATQALPIAERNNWLLDISLDHLTLARVVLYRTLLASPQPAIDYQNPHLLSALDGLREAGQVQYLPPALLTTAQHQHFTGEPDTARRHLDEAQQIAERGPMPLYLADVHLHRARLFRDKTELKLAAELIRKHGYGRRYEELTDAEQASKDW